MGRCVAVSANGDRAQRILRGLVGLRRHQLGSPSTHATPPHAHTLHQDPKVVISALMKLAGGSPSFAAELNVDA